MAIFVYDVTIPPNTAKGKSYVVKAPLPRGVIHKIDIHFPEGVNGVAGVKVTRSGMPIYPSNPGEWFISNGEVITFPEQYEIKETEPEFVIHGFNLSEVNPHTITLRFGILPKEVL